MERPRRYDLQEKLVELLGSGNVYYQPPPNLKMSYPCIVYELDDLQTRYANDLLYGHKTRYQVTVIYRDPDSKLPFLVAGLPYTSMSTHFVVDGLIHTVFTLYH